MRCDLSGKVSLVTGAVGSARRSPMATANGSQVVYTDVDQAGVKAAWAVAGPLAGAGITRPDRSGHGRGGDELRPARYSGQQRGREHAHIA